MKKIILSVFYSVSILALLSSSCRKNSDPIVATNYSPVVYNKCLPIALYLMGVKIYSFTYDGNRKLSRFDDLYDTTHFLYNYNGITLTSLVNYDKNDKVNYKRVFDYNNLGQVELVHTLSSDLVEESQTVFVYTNGNITSDTIYVISGGKKFYNYLEVYKWENGNVVSENTFSYDAGQGKFTPAVSKSFEYDSKLSLGRGVIYNEFDPFIYNSNNQISETNTSSGGTPIKTTTTYEYNSNGYPVKIIESYGEVATVDYDCK